jgi:ketosteroid isomerase-like protein
MSRAMELATAFFDALEGHDAPAALRLLHPSASFQVVPASVVGTAEVEGRRFVESLLRAFPDLTLRARCALDAPELAVVRVTMEGTQASAFLGVLNQEKHLDLEQAWMVWTNGEKISGVRAYWCQNQLYRRLAVRRLDRVSILG